MANKLVIPYGSKHTKKYVKSVVADFLVEENEDKSEMQIISDINLLLRQKSKHRAVGIDLLRDYVDNLQYKQPIQHNFTDEELFSLIEPRFVNNHTTMYEYARYMQEHSNQMKAKYDELVKAKELYLKSNQPSKSD